jgi:hypothetical protein
MTYILERIRDDSEKYAKASKIVEELKKVKEIHGTGYNMTPRADFEKYAKASKNLKELKMKFPCIKTIEKQMKIEFDAQKRKNQECYKEDSSKKSEPEKQFCKFQKRVDEMVKNSRVLTSPIKTPTGDIIQGQFNLIRQPVTA